MGNAPSVALREGLISISALDISGHKDDKVSLPDDLFSNVPVDGETGLPEVCVGQLKWVRLANNGSETLPASLACLHRLECLIAYENRITELSPYLFDNLPALATLLLHGNKLTTLPDNICKLSSLTMLHLDDNTIEHLPDCIGSLGSLRTLSVKDCGLQALNPCIGRLSTLTELILSQNWLSQVPEELQHCGNLEKLHLFDNEIEEFPLAVGKLARLHTLYLHDNKLTDIPLAVVALADHGSLTDCTLYNNPYPDEVKATILSNGGGFPQDRQSVLASLRPLFTDDMLQMLGVAPTNNNGATTEKSGTADIAVTLDAVNISELESEEIQSEPKSNHQTPTALMPSGIEQQHPSPSPTQQAVAGGLLQAGSTSPTSPATPLPGRDRAGTEVARRGRGRKKKIAVAAVSSPVKVEPAAEAEHQNRGEVTAPRIGCCASILKACFGQQRKSCAEDERVAKETQHAPPTVEDASQPEEVIIQGESDGQFTVDIQSDCDDAVLCDNAEATIQTETAHHEEDAVEEDQTEWAPAWTTQVKSKPAVASSRSSRREARKSAREEGLPGESTGVDISEAPAAVIPPPLPVIPALDFKFLPGWRLEK